MYIRINIYVYVHVYFYIYKRIDEYQCTNSHEHFACNFIYIWVRTRFNTHWIPKKIRAEYTNLYAYVGIE